MSGRCPAEDTGHTGPPDHEGPVETMIEAGEWHVVDLPELANLAARATLKMLSLDPSGYEIVLLACDDARIAQLNTQFRGKAKPTNVLSWPACDLGAQIDGARPQPAPLPDFDDPTALGDIALGWQTCAREAAQQGKTLRDHLLHLVVHSVLHLLGYDHIRDKDAALMEETEVLILASIGVQDPYAPGSAFLA